MTGLDFKDYFGFLERRDPTGAVQHALALIDGGADPVDVLLDVVAPAQRQVGLRWAEGAWTVAHEHAATATSESVAIAVGARIPAPADPLGHVILACAEREWHGLPARLVGLQPAGRRLAHHVPGRVDLAAAVRPVPRRRRRRRGRDQLLRRGLAARCPPPDRRRPGGGPAGAGRRRRVRPGRHPGPGTGRVRAGPGTPHRGGRAHRPRGRRRHERPRLDPGSRQACRRGRARGDGDPLRRVSRHRPPPLARRPGDPSDEAGLAGDAVDHALHSLSAALLTDDPRLLREADDWLTALFAARGQPSTTVPSLWRSLHQTVGEPLPEAARHLKAL